MSFFANPYELIRMSFFATPYELIRMSFFANPYELIQSDENFPAVQGNSL